MDPVAAMTTAIAGVVKILVRVTRIGAAAEMARQCRCLSRTSQLLDPSDAGTDFLNRRLLRVTVDHRNRAQRPSRETRGRSQPRRDLVAMSRTDCPIDSNFISAGVPGAWCGRHTRGTSDCRCEWKIQ